MKSGILLLDKAAGLSSTRLGSQVKRLLHVSKLGHVGTLDPFATGLLPLALGRATAVVRYMDDYDKRYRVRCRIGRSTDSLDVSGTTTHIDNIDSSQISQLLDQDAAALRAQLHTMQGLITQVPPLYSAIKVAGKKLYKYAQRGEVAPEIPSRQVHIHAADLLSAQYDAAGDPEAPLVLELDIHCSKGTYIRSFCADLARAFGLSAYAEALRRTAVGPFSIEEALKIEDLSEEVALLPIDVVLKRFPVIEFSLSDVDRLLCGLQVSATAYLEQCLQAQPGLQVVQNERAAQDVQEGRRYLITAAPGPAGVCRLRCSEDGAYFFVVERMFSDRANYFTR